MNAPIITRQTVQGVELGYAQITSDVVQTGVGNQDVTGLSVTVTVRSRPIVISFSAAAVTNSSASGITYVKIMEGATLLGNALVSLTTVSNALYREVRLTPSAGSHTYKINLQQVLAGNSTIFADTSSSYGPAAIRVVET